MKESFNLSGSKCHWALLVSKSPLSTNTGSGIAKPYVPATASEDLQNSSLQN